MNARYMVIPFLVLFSIKSYSDSQNVDNFKQCMGAINELEQGIRDNKSDLDPQYVKALRGAALSNFMSTRKLTSSELDDLPLYKGSINNVHTCIFNHKDAEMMGLLIKAYYGLFSVDPLEDLTSCYAGIVYMAPALEKRFGNKRATTIGYVIGKEVGAVGVYLQYLYRSIKRFDSNYLQSKALEKARLLAQKDKEIRDRAIIKNIGICHWYGVPINSILNNAITSN